MKTRQPPRSYALLVSFMLAVLAVSGSALGTEPAGQSALPPDTIRAGDAPDDRLLWIAADRAGGAAKVDRQLLSGLLPEFDLDQLDRQLHSYKGKRRRGRVGPPTDPCAHAGLDQADYFVPHPSIEDLAVHSQAVFSGTVLAGRQGLLRGSPSTLFAVRVEKVWRFDGRVRPGEIVFVGFSFAEIQVDDAWLCSRGLRYPAIPLPGRKLLAFSFRKIDVGVAIYYPIDQELFFETATALSVPWHLTDELKDYSLRQVESELTEILGEPESLR